jgi:hypothetical protein
MEDFPKIMDLLFEWIETVSRHFTHIMLTELPSD